MSSTNYKEFYTKESGIYHDTRYGGLYGQIFKELHYEALNLSLDKCSSENKMLEIACGTGHTSSFLANKGFRPICTDLTPAMIEKAKKLYPNLKEQVQFIEANALNLPFSNETFDVIVSTRFLHLFNYIEQKKVLTEMFRVLKPGGQIVVDFDSWTSRWIMFIPFLIYNLIKYRRFAPFSFYNRIGKTTNMLKDIGFNIDSIIGIGGTHLVLFAKFSKALSIKLGRLHKKRPLRIMAEQFLVSAKKK